MSGGHYEYAYHHLDELADYIEGDFLNDGKYMSEDYEMGRKWDGSYHEKECDRLEDASEAQKIMILEEIKSLIKDLKNCAHRAKELEWYMSGDTGATSYLERLKK